jgi:hypothetical protein
METKAATWGRIGGLTAWALNDAETMIAPAHRGFRSRFENEVDPGRVLDPAERSARADRAQRAHILRLAARSAEVRRSKASLVSETPSEARSEAQRASAERSAS